MISVGRFFVKSFLCCRSREERKKQKEELMQKNLTTGSLFGKMLQFAVPFLISCFLQTFYGMADLFITGQFNGAAAVSAVAVGSQVMHMLTVVIVGLAMGTTVCISRSVGAGSDKECSGFIGNSVTLFSVFALILTVILLISTGGILRILSVPVQALEEARRYLIICFIGVPFITAYNVISSIFRGLGDTRSPMIFVAIAGLINVGFDYVLIGPLGMGAAGAAIATMGSQAFSVVIALLFLMKGKGGSVIRKSDLVPDPRYMKQLLGIGVPVAFQEGLIQVSFLVITTIANSRGVNVAAAVGIVEKIISFLFLVPSSMLSTVSAVAAQNIGAGEFERARRALGYGIAVCVGVGAVVFVTCQFAADQIVGIFVTKEPEVVRLGGQYLRSYSLDCIIAGIQFCFSGFFSACGKSLYSFIHNITSIALVRIPGAYLASVLFPATLYPMGLAAPMGSLLSSVICWFLYKKLVQNIEHPQETDIITENSEKSAEGG